MDRLLIGQLFSLKLFSVRCPKWRVPVQLPELAHNLGGKGAGEGVGVRGGGGEQ